MDGSGREREREEEREKEGEREKRYIFFLQITQTVACRACLLTPHVSIPKMRSLTPELSRDRAKNCSPSSPTSVPPINPLLLSRYPNTCPPLTPPSTPSHSDGVVGTGAGVGAGVGVAVGPGAGAGTPVVIPPLVLQPVVSGTPWCLLQGKRGVGGKKIEK